MLIKFYKRNFSFMFYFIDIRLHFNLYIKNAVVYTAIDAHFKAKTYHVKNPIYQKKKYTH